MECYEGSCSHSKISKVCLKTFVRERRRKTRAYYLIWNSQKSLANSARCPCYNCFLHNMCPFSWNKTTKRWCCFLGVSSSPSWPNWSTCVNTSYWQADVQLHDPRSQCLPPLATSCQSTGGDTCCGRKSVRSQEGLPGHGSEYKG